MNNSDMYFIVASWTTMYISEFFRCKILMKSVYIYVLWFIFNKPQIDNLYFVLLKSISVDFNGTKLRVVTFLVILTYKWSHSETVPRTTNFSSTSHEIDRNFTDLETRHIYSRSYGLTPISDSMEKVSGPESIVCESYPFGSRFPHYASY